MGLLDGKVALITGAGGGLGEAYAKLFAREGAAVVVNDLGGPRDGSGADVSMAQKVVNAIKEAGGNTALNAIFPGGNSGHVNSELHCHLLSSSHGEHADRLGRSGLGRAHFARSHIDRDGFGQG